MNEKDIDRILRENSSYIGFKGMEKFSEELLIQEKDFPKVAKAIMDKLKEEEKFTSCDDCYITDKCEYSGLGIGQCKNFKKG